MKNKFIFKQNFFYAIFFTIYLLLFNFNSYSKNSNSIDIDSDSFTLNIKDSSMIFSKNVKIKLENFEANCDLSEVYINSRTKKLEKLKMFGNVRIKKQNSEIRANSVIFDPDKNKLSIEGNVKTKILLEN